MPKKYSTCVLEIMIFDENKKIATFMMLGSVIYCIMENHLCADYLCLKQDKIYLEQKGFENTTSNDILGIAIAELLMNIMSCCGFVKNNKTAVILSFHRKLASYYLLK